MPSLLSIGCDDKIINSLSSVDPPIRTVEGFLERNLDSLSLESGLSLDLLGHLKNFLIEKYNVRAISGIKYLLKAKNVNMIFPLNVESIDLLLDNGVYSSYVSEFSGVSGSGKSSLCHMICYNVIKNEGNVIYVDSCNNFDICKIVKQINSNTNINMRMKMLESIRVKRVFRLSDLKLYLLSIIKKMERNDNAFYNNLRIIIIDTINPLLLSNQYNNTEYKSIQQDIIIFNELIHEICSKYNIGIVLINSAVSSNIINNDNKVEYKVSNGIIWSYVSDREYLLEKINNNNSFKMSVLKGPNMNMSCEYHIDENGLIC